ncbi:MAG: PP2C family protein-serine/threonine phosphatase [Acidobacteriota bacterium]
MMDSDARFLISFYPTASIALHFKDPDTNQATTYVNQGQFTGSMETFQIPDWVQGSTFSGLVVEDVQPEVYKERLFLRCFVVSDFTSDFEFSLEVSVPFDQNFLNRLKRALGQDVLLADQIEIPRLNAVFQNVDVPLENIVDSTFNMENSSRSTWSGWLFSLFPTSWADGEERTSFDLGVLLVEPSAAKLLANIYASENQIGKRILVLLQAITIVFLLFEFVSIWIGVRLTRSITAAVQSLDSGTEFVKRGEFGHRIEVRSKDQLGALGASFNQMTEYVQELIRERVFKERMDRELEIAREVQQQLFPNRAPLLNHLDVSGACLPARVVSGDYFDYMPLDEYGLGIAVADICGKGISAALLMANLQAALRSNVISLRQNGKGSYETTVAEIVHRLNSQMYGYTADNKFATLFYGVYSDLDRTLTYCNAGHNPPIYVEGNSIRRLKVGGTVVGIFPHPEYEQEKIQLNDNGILVAFTDGIVESVNKSGEEFGDDRIIEIVQRNKDLDAEHIKERIVDSVLEWSSTEERGDDMTLIVAKVRSLA